MKPSTPFSRMQLQRGLTLIEMMVAVVISLLLTAGVIQIFVGSKQTYRFQEALSRVQESGRFVVEMINRDLRAVDYSGCGGRSFRNRDEDGDGNPDGITNTLNNSGSLAWNFAQGVVGSNYETASSDWVPALDADLTNDPHPPLANSDVLTVRVPDLSSSISVQQHPGGNPPGSAAIMVDPDNGFNQGDIVIVTTCQSAAVFQISSANPNTSGQLAHNTGATVSPGNATAALGANMTGGDVMRIATHTYYVALGDNGRPSLWRKDNAAPARELIDNVERMEIVYGEDTSVPADFVVDRYVDAATVANWSQVLSVRISVLLASNDDQVTDEEQWYWFDGVEQQAGDRRLREVFTTTAALRNRMP